LPLGVDGQCTTGTLTPTMLQPDSLLLTSDVARFLHVSAETVRHYERQGRLAARRTLGGARIFAGGDVLRLRDERAAVRSVPEVVGAR
jgi:predicted site-specific integrase-resolvase